MIKDAGGSHQLSPPEHPPPPFLNPPQHVYQAILEAKFKNDFLHQLATPLRRRGALHRGRVREQSGRVRLCDVGAGKGVKARRPGASADRDVLHVVGGRFNRVICRAQGKIEFKVTYGRKTVPFHSYCLRLLRSAYQVKNLRKCPSK